MPKPNILTLNEFRKLKGQQNKPVTVYFDETQWKNLIKKAKPAEPRPLKPGVVITAMELSGAGGGLLHIYCYKTKAAATGPFIEPSGIIRCDPPGKPGKSISECSVKISDDGLTCIGICNDPLKTCKLSIIGAPNQIMCECK